MTAHNIDTMELLKMIAYKLTGELVDVKPGQTQSGALADCGATAEGFEIILTPRVLCSVKSEIDAFLHECAHIKLHGDLLRTGKCNEIPDGEKGGKDFWKIQHEATVLSSHWKQYGHEHRDWYGMAHKIRGEQIVQQHLIALLDIPDEVNERFYQKARSMFRA